MKKLAIFAALAFAGLAAAQDAITIPDKIDCKTGRLASVKIVSAAKDTRWVISPSEEIDVFREYDPDPSVIRLRFVPLVDGSYYLTVGGALGDKESLKTCTLIATGGSPPNPPPTPVPPVPPGPTPPVPPTPPPAPPTPDNVVADFVVGVVDNNNRTQAQAGILMDGELLSWLNGRNIKWRVVAVGTEEYNTGRYPGDLATAKVTAPAAICYSKGKVIRAVSADKVPTSDAVKTFIQGKSLADEKIAYDPSSDELYFKDGPEKRRLNRLSPDKASLVPLRQAVRWKDAKLVLPRETWRPVSRRDVFPANQWILDQNGVGSCVGNGAAAAERKARFFMGMLDVKLSPGCLYAQINGGRDQGAVIGDSMTALLQTGTTSYATIGESPYFLHQLPAGWQSEAKRFRAAEVYVTPTFDEMASAIQLGYVVVYGMMVGNNFESFTNEGVAGISSGQGNHCMHADGMTKLANGSWAFDNANSWGEPWGPWKNGRCYLVEGHFSHADTRDAYAIKSATLDPQDPVKPPAAVPVIPFSVPATYTTPASIPLESYAPAPAGYRWVCAGGRCVLVKNSR